MRRYIAIGLIGVTLTAMSAPARAGDEAAAFVFGTLVGSALANDGSGSRLHVSHYPARPGHRHARGSRAYARGYRDATRALRYAPPPKAFRYGYRHGRAHGHRHGWRGRGHWLPGPAAREIYRHGYRDARRDFRRAERRHERREARTEQRREYRRDQARDLRRGGRPTRHEVRRRH